MDYRVYKGGVPANTNVVKTIVNSIREGGQAVHGPLKFVGFEGNVGTEFYLNNHEETNTIPECGYFITPYAADRFMPVYNLEFPESFSGNIYYII